PLMNSLPNPDDNPFLEVALAGNTEYLVTGNINHFPSNLCQGIKIVSPSNFTIEYKKIWCIK
ncbi:MAG: putative toxin-antitoxin system toxin component, PIN family, partial [Candidatus Marinimicrobia bacterium]|nr:putative toxin-antitoxin system toxin component, PIN family [Candidatus Neomarinimicrobiota bacterium]